MSIAGENRIGGTVSAALPLSLLEAVRAHDRPGEILEGEDLTISLPRRLGLTGVFDTQIRRYEEARSKGKFVSADEVVSLMRLVLKRPDAQAILADTGRRMADAQFARVPSGYLKVLRALPRGVLTRSYRRAARRLLRLMTGNATVEITGRPPVVRISDSPMVQLEPPGSGCALYSAALESLAESFTGNPATVSHARCASGGGNVCEWSVEGF